MPWKANATSLISPTRLATLGERDHPSTYKDHDLKHSAGDGSACRNLALKVRVIRTRSKVIASHVIPLSDVAYNTSYNSRGVSDLTFYRRRFLFLLQLISESDIYGDGVRFTSSIESGETERDVYIFSPKYIYF